MTAQTKVIQMQFIEKGASKVTNGVKKMGGAAKGATTQFGSLKSALMRLGGFIAITAALKSATTAALDFGSAMAEVSTLLPNNDEMVELTSNVKKLSLAYGKGATEEAKALYQIISAGASTAAQATDVLNVSNKLAIGGVTDVATAADGLTSILNAYGTEAGTAIEVSDALFVAMKAGKTTIGEMAGAIGAVATISAQAGVSIEELLSATAALTKGGLSTSMSMRGLKSAMSNIIVPSEKALALAKHLKIEFSAAALKAKGFAQFLDEIKVATKGDTEMMGQLFGSIEALGVILALTGKAADDFTTNLAAMDERAGATDEAFNKIAQTAQFKLNRFLSAMKLIAISIGNVLLTVLAPAALLVAENLDILAASVIALSVALVAIKWTAIVAGLKAIVIGVKTLSVALLTTPLGWFIAAISAITIGIVMLNRKFMILGPTWDMVKAGFMIGINAMKMALNSFLNWIDKMWAKLQNGLQDFKIKYQEGMVFLAEKIGTSAGYANSLAELERLTKEQEDYNTTLLETVKGREDANAELVKENDLLMDNWNIAKEQLFTEREKQDLAAGAGTPNAPAPAGSPDLTADFDAQIEKRQKLLAVELRGVELLKSMRTPMEIYRDKLKELNELYEADAISLETYNRAMTKYQDEMKKSSEATDEFAGLMEKAINGTLTAKDLFLVAVKQILNGLLQMNNEATSTKNSFLELGQSLGSGGGLGGSLGGILGSIIGNFFSPTPAVGIPPPPVPINPAFTGLLAADGAMMHRGVKKFAKGGVFNSPTAFPMQGGMGVMAEAEAEAIMPLERGAGGRLGVSASGITPTVNIAIIDQRSGGDKPEVKETRDANGNRQVSIFIRDQVNKGFADGAFDKSLKIFNVSRSGTRR